MLETIAISPEEDYPNEQDWVVKLFEAGLSRFHVRKPGVGDDELETYIQKIPARWRKRVIPHQAYELVDALDLGGWHFKDDAVQLRQAEKFRKSRSSSQILSRSIHCLDDLNEDMSKWDYVFLSPVFQSISKRDYGPQWEEAQLTAALRYCKEAYQTRVYALGGVDASHIYRCGEMGFDGVALLGDIWQSRYPLESFLKVKEALCLPISS
ncbi:MAG: thiamine phosphate synthase [Verrucomicrobia bacterium]|nr:thiamine phosphate synthase [Verrucomicrobiota bacterium]